MAFDALVLLGCRVATGALPGPAERRVRRTATAFAAGLAPRVVVSGGKRWGASIEADALAQALETAGVAREVLLLERDAKTTFENARFTAKLLLPLGFSRVGIVTCDWHLPRALWNFRRAGLVAEPVPAQSPNASVTSRSLRTLREGTAWLHDRAVAFGW